MRFLMRAGLGFLVAAGAFAQHHGGGMAGHAGAWHGHGGGHFTHGYAYHGYGGFRGYYPLYWPSFYSWGWPYYDYSSAYTTPYETAPNVNVIYPPPAEPAPPVVINMPVHSVIREYHQPEDYGLPPEHEGRPVLYLIAFNDHVIHAATTYWVEGEKLHYLDTDHKEKQTPLSSVDRDLSGQLNRERHVPFRLQ